MCSGIQERVPSGYFGGAESLVACGWLHRRGRVVGYV